MDTTANESQPDATAVNIFSKILTAGLGQITCPVHECCDGSCQPHGPIKFEAPRYGEMSFDIQIGRKTETSILPLEPIPIHLPTEAFQYSAIDSQNGQVRLLRVQPAVFLADPVMVELIDARLDNSPDYTALSYHWGPPLFDHSIICNGKALHVNKSLHNALKRHRQEVMCASDRSDLLWADAICINQKDAEELNEQVLLMLQIYHKAERVVVDLGDVPLEWYFAFDLMKRIEMVKEAVKSNSTGWHFSITLAPQSYGLPSFDHHVWRMYFHIFSSPWFFRTWIIQEVSLARAIFVRAGRFTFEWDLLWGTYMFFYNNESGRKMLGDMEAQVGYLNLQKILAIRDLFRQGRLTPIKLLDLARDFKVSNPRDKIIGLIGLLPQGENCFRPDYSWSETKLFHNFATYIIGNALQPRPWGSEDRISLLSHAGLQRQSDGCSLPSWAPDWTAQSRDGPKAVSTIRKRPYAAATPVARLPGQRADAFPGLAAGLFIEDVEPGLLCVLSLRVDTITAISSTCRPREVENRHAYDQWKLWHNDAQTVLRDAALRGEFQYADSEAAFSRTLLADDTYSGIDTMRQFPPIDNPSAARLGAVASTGKSPDPAVATYQMQAATACQSRRFTTTSNGYIGLVPASSEIGDVVYLFSGFSVPFVLRGRQNGHFVLVGDAYVHGIMEGEFWREGNVKWPYDWAPVMLC